MGRVRNTLALLLLAGLSAGGCAAAPWSLEFELPEESASRDRQTPRGGLLAGMLRQPSSLATASVDLGADEAESEGSEALVAGKTTAAGKATAAESAAPSTTEFRKPAFWQELDPAMQAEFQRAMQSAPPALREMVIERLEAEWRQRRTNAAEGDSTAEHSAPAAKPPANPLRKSAFLIASETPIGSGVAAKTEKNNETPDINAESESGEPKQLPSDESAKPLAEASAQADQKAAEGEDSSSSESSQPSDEEPAEEDDAPDSSSKQNDAATSETKDWSELLADTISALEDAARDVEASDGEDDEEAEAAQLAAKLRLLYVLAGRREDALGPIESLPQDQQEYWKQQANSLHVLLDPKGAPVEGKRAALALRSLREAVGRLAAVASLDVRNLAFCDAVYSFGDFSEIEPYTFRSDQEVLLYFEVDNFTAQKRADGYTTRLQGAAEIFDLDGRRVSDQTFPLAEEVCRNRRRDYFIRYRMYMPKNLSPGEYTLRLTVEDLIGNKFGQGVLKFQMR